MVPAFFSRCWCTRTLRPLTTAVLLAFSVAGTIGAPVVVQDWTIDTPLGRVGYAEIDYTLMIHLGSGPRKPTRYFFLGPLGQVGVPLTAPTVAFGGAALVLAVGA